MSKRRLFIYLAAATGYIGIGMLLGYSFGERTINTALWIGILLVLISAVLIGMYISARNDNRSFKSAADTQKSSSGQVPFDPEK